MARLCRAALPKSYIPMSPADLIRMKQIYPVALTTEQVDALSQEFREQAAWIVGQDEAYIIEAYYKAAAAIAEGKLSASEAREAVRDVLEMAGYQAENPGSWGDLMDGTARQKLILETNLDKAASRAWYEAAKNDVTRPAQRLVRTGHRKQERDWNARWRAAYDSLPPEQQARACADQPVAMLDCAIWRALSRWGDPYPPFDYGSGMDVRPVRVEEARALGLPVDTYAADDAEVAAVRKELTVDLTPEHRAEIEAWMSEVQTMMA